MIHLKLWLTGVALSLTTTTAHATVLRGIGGVCLDAVCGSITSPLRDGPLSAIPPEGKGRVVEVPSDGIERYMRLASDKDGVPPSIQGLWWMDGNPLGDILVTVADTGYDPITRTFALAIGSEGTYSFRTSELARSAYEGGLRSNFYYAVQFNEDFTFARLTPVVGKGDDRQEIGKEWIDFTMTLLEDGHWVRESWLAGIRILDYQLRRVVRVDGVRDPAYADYLRYADKYSYLIGQFD